MKIEIEANSTAYNLHLGDKVLKINGEEVLKGDKTSILKKIKEIIEAWF